MIMLIFISVLPDANAKSTLVDVGEKLAGPIGAFIITLTAVFSISGNIAATILTAPRITYAMSEQNLLPSWFSHVHNKYLTPDYSIWFIGTMILLFAASGTFVWLAAVSSLARLIAYLMCAASIPVIRRRCDRRGEKQGFRLPFGYFIPAIAAIMCIWMTMHANEKSWITVIGLSVVGLIFYWYESRKQQIKATE